MRISDWSSDVCSSDLRRQRRILGHTRQRLRIGIEHVLPADARRDKFGPGIAFEITGEEFAGATHLFGLEVHVVHELVDEGDGDLFDLALWVDRKSTRLNSSH